jgi:hypothetical protein
MKSGEDCDIIATKDNIIAFEMEGARVWDNLLCVVIKGVCDYADSHKNKEWQGYAAVTAASCMKAFLREWFSADKSLTTNSMQLPFLRLISCLSRRVLTCFVKGPIVESAS